MYQNVLASLNAWHATLFQYASALATDGVAAPRVGPDTGLHFVRISYRSGNEIDLPSCLGDPHLDSRVDIFDNSLDVIHRLPKHFRAACDYIVLEVWIAIGAHEVAGFDDLEGISRTTLTQTSALVQLTAAFSGFTHAVHVSTCPTHIFPAPRDHSIPRTS